MQRNAIIVLDVVAIGPCDGLDNGGTYRGGGGDNKLIVPEPALDFFDEDAKARTVAASGSATAGTSPTTAPANAPDAWSPGSALWPTALIHQDKLRQRKNVSLNRAASRVVVQRVDEYDAELKKKLQNNPKSYDTRLFVLCALFFCKKFKKPTIIASSDPAVQQMAAELQLPTCEPVGIANCGDLLGPAPYVAPKTPVVTPKPEPKRQKSPLCRSKARSRVHQ
ncbi:hypothetical protein JIQ42_07554 [Leishmania sp. Namibia]|uniref:hypothetical protein n=1 Tax=Leishmania sp. Namibia TaxID=2802991 RepID=UPI001B5A813F|nr:hypothetical protein JIQ42_07554 [Leishmania sp. Namibia]